MIICMKMREFTTNYLENSSLEDVKNTIFVPVGHNIRADGSMTNVIAGGEITPIGDALLDAGIYETKYNSNEVVRKDITVSESLRNIGCSFDNDINKRKFLANMVKYSLKHPQRYIIILCEDREADNYNYLNFYREYFYARYGYPCVLGIGGGLKLQERDKFLLMECIVQPNKRYLKEVRKKVDEDLQEYREHRRKLWEYDKTKRITDMSSMSKKELYKECQHINYDNLNDISYYNKDDLIEILSEYYGTGVSDEEVRKFIMLMNQNYGMK